MADRTVLLRCSSPAEIDAQLDKCKAAAVRERAPVEVVLHLDPPRNAACPFCDGRKWKQCQCREEDVFTLTFYPEGYRLPTRRERRLDRIMAAALVAGLEGLTLQ